MVFKDGKQERIEHFHTFSKLSEHRTRSRSRHGSRPSGQFPQPYKSMRGARSVRPAGCQEIAPALLDDPTGQLLGTPKHPDAMDAPPGEDLSVDLVESDDLFLRQFRLAGSDLIWLGPEVED